MTAGQTFHWFDPIATRREMSHILRAGGQAALIWNTREVTGSPFQAVYEDLLLRFGTDFKKVDHQRNFPADKLAAFFAPNAMSRTSFRHEQIFDLAGLQGRLLASSYAPTPQDAHYLPMLDALRQIFDRFERNGAVHFRLLTEVYHEEMTQ